MGNLLTIERKVGRLVEARFSGNPTVEDIAEWARAAEGLLKTGAARLGKGAVCCTDMRASALFRPAVTEALTSIMRADNRVVERNAILGIGGATFTLQLQRLLREAQPIGEIRRRVFIEQASMYQWLEELLTPVESARLRAFVDEFDPTTAEMGLAFTHSTVGAGAVRKSPTPTRTESRFGPARTASPSSPDARESEDRPPAPRWCQRSSAAWRALTTQRIMAENAHFEAYTSRDAAPRRRPAAA
jgi:hypothetical protein